MGGERIKNEGRTMSKEELMFFEILKINALVEVVEPLGKR